MSACEPITVISFAIDFATLVAIVVGIIAWWIYRRTLRYHALVAIQKDYRSTQMGYAVDSLWRFYREDCGGKTDMLLENYEKTYYEERNGIDTKEKTKLIEAEKLPWIIRDG